MLFQEKYTQDETSKYRMRNVPRVKSAQPPAALWLYRISFGSTATRCAPLFLLLILSACSATGLSNNKRISYTNPPPIGSWLPSQRELAACETMQAARFMADFGFFHPQCHQLLNAGVRDYKVINRTLVELSEGPMWLLDVEKDGQTYYLPIPWHDWL